MSFLDRERTIAEPGFRRWLVPPAALAVHLSIGQVYAFSVFKIPLTQSIGITHSAPGDWDQPSLAWIFSIAIAFLGISAAVFGRWVEKNGPRKTMLAAAWIHLKLSLSWIFCRLHPLLLMANCLGSRALTAISNTPKAKALALSTKVECTIKPMVLSALLPIGPRPLVCRCVVKFRYVVSCTAKTSDSPRMRSKVASR